MEAGPLNPAPPPANPPGIQSAARALLLYWLPVALWIAVIFSMSTGLGSSRHTSRIIGPILRWFHPDVADETIRTIQLGIRKTAHVTEYAILALLCLRALRQGRPGLAKPWTDQSAFIALAIAVLVAATDEWHQTFVPSREGTVRDVFIDSAGALAGLLTHRWLSHRRPHG